MPARLDDALDTVDLDTIDLDALVKPVGRIKVFGKQYDVLPINGRAFDLAIGMRKKGTNGDTQRDAEQSLAVAREMVAECVPSLSATDRARLNIDQLTAIASVSMRQVVRVQAIIDRARGKARGPTRKTRARPRSTPR